MYLPLLLILTSSKAVGCMQFKMLSYPVTSRFGEIDSVHPKPHTGIDIATPAGTPAQSLVDGIVSKVSANDMLGNHVRVQGVDGKELVFGHLSKISVSPGQQINAGDILGLTGGVPGSPGAGHSTGAHIHISALSNGQIVDPTPTLTAITQTDSTWIERLATSVVDKLFYALGTPFRALFDSLGTIIKDSIDPLFFIVTFGLVLLSIMGSQKAKKGMFWSVSLYAVLKLIVTSL